jgi:RNA polymerase sigma-B factor
VSIEAILEARLAAPAMRTVGLDQPPPGETGDGLPPIARFGRLDGGYDGVEQRSLLKALTSQLSDRNREILVLRYAGELPQSEIARRVGSSQMTVSRILRRSIAELQATLDDHAGRDAA